MEMGSFLRAWYGDLFNKEKTEFISYDATWLESYYRDVKLLAFADDKIKAPFEVLYDYRNKNIADWGTYVYEGEFVFPPKLNAVKEEMVKLFSKAGKLYKGDSYCPRIRDIEVTPQGPIIYIQKATYYDQVATNLTIDYKHTEAITKLLGTDTIRLWDMEQSQTPQGSLPSLSRSCLANTIGIALGIMTVNKAGKQVVLLRQRTATVAVHENTLTLPMSFALNFDHSKNCHNAGALLDLVKADIRQEQLEEMGWDANQLDISDIKPLLLCRELSRGGKPQFIFEIKTKYTFEELARRIKEKRFGGREFTSRIVGLSIEDIISSASKLSSDVQAFIVAKSGEEIIEDGAQPFFSPDKY
jgi:hypothetical protein